MQAREKIKRFIAILRRNPQGLSLKVLASLIPCSASHVYNLHKKADDMGRRAGLKTGEKVVSKRQKGKRIYYLVSSSKRSQKKGHVPKISFKIIKSSYFPNNKLEEFALELGKVVLCSLCPESINMLQCKNKQHLGVCLPIKSDETFKLEILKEILDSLQDGFFIVITTLSQKKSLILPIKLVLSSLGLAVICFKLKKVPKCSCTFLSHGRRVHILPLNIVKTAKRLEGNRDKAKDIRQKVFKCMRRSLDHAVLLHSENGEAHLMNVEIVVERDVMDVFKSAVFKKVEIQDEQEELVTCSGKIRNIPQFFVFLSQVFQTFETKSLKLSITRNN